MPFPNKETQFSSGQVAVEAQLKSAEAKKRNNERRKAFREILDEEFEKMVKVNGNSEKQITRKEAVALRLMQILMDSGTQEKDFIRAMEFARDTIGEKPVDKVVVADIDQQTIDEVEAMVKGGILGVQKPEISGKVLKVDKNTGEVLDGYKNASEAARANGIDPSNLNKAIKSGKASGGYLWKRRE